MSDTPEDGEQIRKTVLNEGATTRNVKITTRRVITKPAELMHLQRGDVVVEYNGRRNTVQAVGDDLSAEEGLHAEFDTGAYMPLRVLCDELRDGENVAYIEGERTETKSEMQPNCQE
jgi:hypothetical protein